MTAWYEESFGYDYLELYAHRDDAEARSDVRAIIELLDPPRDEPLLDLCCGACRHILVLREMGFDIPVEPGGAFYIYADCSAITQDAFAWTGSLLEDEAVALTPGIDFGEYGASTHVRFAYTRPVDQLERACSRIARYIQKGRS